MSEYRNVLCLDVGERRIGVALASLDARLPSPLVTIDRQKTDNITTSIQQLVEKNQIGTLVIGLPRGMAGQETAQTTAIRQFVDDLKMSLDIPIELQDEAGTSLAAEDELKAKGRPYEKGDIDALAATLILNDWLAGQTQEAHS